MGKNQEVYDAELHAIYRAMLTLSPSSQTPRQPYRGLYIRRTRPRTAIRSRNRTTGTRPVGATKSRRPIPMGPQPCRHRRQREGRRRRVGKDCSTERTRLRATALRVQHHFPGPPEMRYHRAEVGRGMLMDGVTLEQAPRVPTTEEDAARPDAGVAFGVLFHPRDTLPGRVGWYGHAYGGIGRIRGEVLSSASRPIAC